MDDVGGHRPASSPFLSGRLSAAAYTHPGLRSLGSHRDRATLPRRPRGPVEPSLLSVVVSSPLVEARRGSRSPFVHRCQADAIVLPRAGAGYVPSGIIPCHGVQDGTVGHLLTSRAGRPER
jgi:hypothetical protein